MPGFLSDAFRGLFVGGGGIIVGAVGMWESRSDFQGRGKTQGNLGLVFLVFHGPTFPRRSEDFHARLRSCRKPRNNLFLACCMLRADSVSLCWLAIRSSFSMLSGGLR